MESDRPKKKKLHSIQLSKHVINSIADWRNRKQLYDERSIGIDSHSKVHDEEVWCFQWLRTQYFVHDG